MEIPLISPLSNRPDAYIRPVEILIPGISIPIKDIPQPKTPVQQPPQQQPEQFPQKPLITTQEQSIPAALKELNIPLSPTNIQVAQTLANFGQGINMSAINYVKQLMVEIRDKSPKAMEAALILIMNDLPVTEENVSALQQLVYGQPLSDNLKQLGKELNKLQGELRQLVNTNNPTRSNAQGNTIGPEQTFQAIPAPAAAKGSLTQTNAMNQPFISQQVGQASLDKNISTKMSETTALKISNPQEASSINKANLPNPHLMAMKNGGNQQLRSEINLQLGLSSAGSEEANQMLQERTKQKSPQRQTVDDVKVYQNKTNYNQAENVSRSSNYQPPAKTASSNVNPQVEYEPIPEQFLKQRTEAKTSSNYQNTGDYKAQAKNDSPNQMKFQQGNQIISQDKDLSAYYKQQIMQNKNFNQNTNAPVQSENRFNEPNIPNPFNPSNKPVSQPGRPQPQSAITEYIKQQNEVIGKNTSGNQSTQQTGNQQYNQQQGTISGNSQNIQQSTGQQMAQQGTQGQGSQQANMSAQQPQGQIPANGQNFQQGQVNQFNAAAGQQIAQQGTPGQQTATQGTSRQQANMSAQQPQGQIPANAQNFQQPQVNQFNATTGQQIAQQGTPGQQTATQGTSRQQANILAPQQQGQIPETAQNFQQGQINQRNAAAGQQIAQQGTPGQQTATQGTSRQQANIFAPQQQGQIPEEEQNLQQGQVNQRNAVTGQQTATQGKQLTQSLIPQLHLQLEMFESGEPEPNNATQNKLVNENNPEKLKNAKNTNFNAAASNINENSEEETAQVNKNNQLPDEENQQETGIVRQGIKSQSKISLRGQNINPASLTNQALGAQLADKLPAIMNKIVNLNSLIQTVLNLIGQTSLKDMAGRIASFKTAIAQLETEIADFKKEMLALFPNLNNEDVEKMVKPAQNNLDTLTKMLMVIEEGKDQSPVYNMKKNLPRIYPGGEDNPALAALKPLAEEMFSQLEKVGLQLYAREILSQANNSLCIPFFMNLGNTIFNNELVIKYEDEDDKNQNSGKQRINLTLAVETQNLGKVVVDVSTFNKEIQLKLNVINRRTQLLFNDRIKNLQGLLEKINYEVKSLTCNVNPYIDKQNSVLLPPRQYMRTLRRIEGII